MGKLFLLLTRISKLEKVVVPVASLLQQSQSLARRLHRRQLSTSVSAPQTSERRPASHRIGNLLQLPCYEESVQKSTLSGAPGKVSGIGSSTSVPLRVMCRVDTEARGGTGRLVISGRMADVCAELDRLAKLESLRSQIAA